MRNSIVSTALLVALCGVLQTAQSRADAKAAPAASGAATAAMPAGTAPTAAAQTAAAQSARPSLSLADARRVLASALEAARSRNAPGAAIAIVDAGGQVVALERLDGTFPAAPSISIGKARTAVNFHRPTRQLEDIINKGRVAMVTLPAVVDFTPLQGGVPLVVAGETVGAIGVSGAASAAQDDEIAQAAADAYAASPRADAVQYRPAQQVQEAFARGDRLLASPGWTVNASRRDGPGVAEIHERDTDLIYVLSGEAEFLTGGEIVGAQRVADGELRGSAIAGGDTHRLAAGDVISVPRGVPHWFRSVRAPFTYYVVKTAESGS